MISIQKQTRNGHYIEMFLLITPKGRIYYEVRGPVNTEIVDDNSSTPDCNLRCAREMFERAAKDPAGRVTRPDQWLAHP